MPSRRSSFLNVNVTNICLFFSIVILSQRFQLPQYETNMKARPFHMHELRTHVYIQDSKQKYIPYQPLCLVHGSQFTPTVKRSETVFRTCQPAHTPTSLIRLPRVTQPLAHAAAIQELTVHNLHGLQSATAQP